MDLSSLLLRPLARPGNQPEAGSLAFPGNRQAGVRCAARRERGARLNLRGVAGAPGSKLALGDFS